VNIDDGSPKEDPGVRDHGHRRGYQENQRAHFVALKKDARQPTEVADRDPLLIRLRVESTAVATDSGLEFDGHPASPPHSSHPQCPAVIIGYHTLSREHIQGLSSRRCEQAANECLSQSLEERMVRPGTHRSHVLLIPRQGTPGPDNCALMGHGAGGRLPSGAAAALDRQCREPISAWPIPGG